MADQASALSPTRSPGKISSFLGSPRVFKGVLIKARSDSETIVMSPTSILDSKSSAIFVNPFGFDNHQSKASSPSTELCKYSGGKPETEAIGLALIDSISEEKNDGSFSKPISRMSLFGSKLKVQIPAANPSVPPSPAAGSPESPVDFGIKTRSSQFLSPVCGAPEKNAIRQLSWKEMELSEDYTCVITHGPNPKTTHIFDGCIVKSCSGDDANFPDHKKTEPDSELNGLSSPFADFLSFCHTCRESLEQGKDSYTQRGERALCSQECHCQEMVFEGV